MTPPSNGTLQPGDSVGPYIVDSVLGQGGMGIVYGARRVGTGEPVALKLLRPGPHIESRSAYRLLREGFLLAAIDHPNICTILDVGRDHGRPFVAMERLSGATLHDVVANGPLGASEVIDIGIQLAEALAAAERCDLIHRDLKSSNVMLTDDGRVKVLDFGLAGTRAECRPDAPDDVRITEPGFLAGTTAYMSPEQALGCSVDHQSDLYALGVILYELLTGALPFRGCSHRELVRAILNDRHEPLLDQRPDLPEALAALVDRLLHKSRDRRHASAADVSRELCRIRDGDPARVRVRRAMKTRMAQRLAGTAAGVLLATLGLYPASRAAAIQAEATLWSNPTRRPGVWTDSSVLRRPLAIVEFGDRPSSVSIGNDGRLVYERTTARGASTIWTVGATDAAPRAVAQGEEPRLLASGREVAFVGAGGLGLYRADLDDLSVVRLYRGRAAWLTAMPDGDRLLFVDVARRGLWSIATGGGAPVLVTMRQVDSRPVVSPDGERIAFLSGGRTLACQAPRCTSETWLSLDAPQAWTPDGLALAYVGQQRRNIWLAPLGDGSPVRLTNFYDREVTSLAWSPDGRRVAITRVPTARDLLAVYFSHR